MPDIFPFRGTHFDPKRVGDLSQVVTQPYDKIPDALREEYLKRHENNFVRLIKRVDEPGDSTGMKKYQAAARTLEEWRKSGALITDKEPAFYAYYQTYSTPQGEKTRKGFIAMVRAEPFDKGRVRPHEQTHSGPKIDRYNLLEATKSHFGQIFMIYSDPNFTINRITDEVATREPDLQAKDDYGYLHRVWRIADPDAVAAIRNDMRRRDAIIADGHHRYETAVKFHQDKKKQGAKVNSPNESYQNVMATLVNMEDEGLTIYPGHRVVYDWPRFDAAALRRGVEKYFDVREYPFENEEEEKSARQDMLEDLRLEGIKTPAFGVALASGSPYYLYMLRDRKAAGKLVKEKRSDEWKSLDVSVLHTAILEAQLGIGHDVLDREESVAFIRYVDDALAKLREPGVQAAFLMNPVKLDQIKTLVKKGERFPQKSTDFYPKMLSGLVFCTLDFSEP